MPRRRTRTSRAPRTVGGAALLAAVAAPLGAQRVVLRIHPQVGDTIHMRMDQVTEMTGSRREGGDTTTVTSKRVTARAIVRKVDTQGATVLAVTDSISVEGGRAGAEDRARREMNGRQVTLRIATDGSMDLQGDDARDAAPELRGLFASMPSTLPRDPVAVGETWHRAIPVPTVAGGGIRAGTMLRAVFTLDSLSREGSVAYISMRASLEREVPHDKLPPGARFVTTGVLSGTMQVDRRRGWMTDSRTTVSVHSVATPPPGSRAEPLHFRMKVTQWLRAVDRR